MLLGFLRIMGGKSKSIEKSQKSQKKVENCPNFITIELAVLKE